MKDLKTPVGGHLGGVTAESYEFGPFRLDRGTRELWQGDRLVALTPKAFDLLCALVRSGGRAVEKNELMKLLWPDSFVSDDSLTQAISAVRKALGDTSRPPAYILTIPTRGYRFIADVHELDDTTDERSSSTVAIGEGPERCGPGMRRMAAATIVAVMLLASGFLLGRRELPHARTFRLAVNAPVGTTLASSGMVSPDGRRVAFVARDRTGRTQLFVRDLDGVEPRGIPGTEDAQRPFWSPDSAFVAFFAQGFLKTVGIAGYPVQTLTTVGHALGGSWGRDGQILFAPNRRSALSTIRASGGTPAPLTALDETNREAAHRWPYVLTDGRRYLFSVVSANPDQQGVYLARLDSARRTRLLDGSYSAAVYAPPSHVLSVRDGSLFALPLDDGGLAAPGAPVLIASGVASPDPMTGMGISVAGDVLAYSTDTMASHLVWFNRAGERLGSIDTPGNLGNPVLSSDDSQVIAQQRQVDGEGGIWVMDVRRGTRTRLTTDGTVPLWSPDGKAVVFTSGRARGVLDVYRRPSNSAGVDELVLRTATNKRVHGWSPDGQYIVYVNSDPTTKDDLWLLPVRRDQPPMPYLRTLFNERAGQVSPDGRWMAYMSDESGSWEVYVQSFPQPGNKRAISSHGGAQPQWRRDGRELFFLAPDHTLMAVDVTLGTAFDAQVPRSLFRPAITGDLLTPRNHYAVSSDGQRFLIDTPDIDAPPSIVVVINWFTAFRTP